MYSKYQHLFKHKAHGKTHSAQQHKACHLLRFHFAQGEHCHLEETGRSCLFIVFLLNHRSLFLLFHNDPLIGATWHACNAFASSNNLHIAATLVAERIEGEGFHPQQLGMLWVDRRSSGRQFWGNPHHTQHGRSGSALFTHWHHGLDLSLVAVNVLWLKEPCDFAMLLVIPNFFLVVPIRNNMNKICIARNGRVVSCKILSTFKFDDTYWDVAAFPSTPACGKPSRLFLPE